MCLVTVVSPLHRCLCAELMAPAWRLHIPRQPADRPHDSVDRGQASGVSDDSPPPSRTRPMLMLAATTTSDVNPFSA
jgi:hypothetical protein